MARTPTDISDWMVEGFGGEAAKPALDDFVWDGSAVAGITLQTSPDNKKIVASRMFVPGTLMQNRKERQYHDSAQKGRSVGAVVASMNSTFTKYLSVANLHTNPAQELNDNMCPAIAKALRKYAEINGNLPARIIMYRYVLMRVWIIVQTLTFIV